MTDSEEDPLAALDAKIQQVKKDYWNELVQKDDPDAIEKHDALCVELDATRARVHAEAARIDELFEQTRQAMMNTTIAHHVGDHEEVEQLVEEHASGVAPDAPLCMTCGTKMRPTGLCYVCERCGSTSGTVAS
jgi:ribonucleoside-diphosphate reductase alpha chain